MEGHSALGGVIFLLLFIFKFQLRNKIIIFSAFYSGFLTSLSFFPFLPFSTLWWFISVWRFFCKSFVGNSFESYELFSYLKCPSKCWLKSLPSISCPCRLRKFSIKTFILRGQSSMLENP